MYFLDDSIAYRPFASFDTYVRNKERKNSFRLEHNDKKYVLKLGTLEREKIKCTYSNDEYIRSYFKENGFQIVFDEEMKEIIFNNCTTKDLNLRECADANGIIAALEFLSMVAMYTNEYIYRALTDVNFELKELKNSNLTNSFTANCLMHIDKLDMLEKLAKQTGLIALAKSLNDPDFTIEKTKKLRASVQLPMTVLSWIKSQNLGDCLSLIQKVVNGDDTIANKLLAYLKAVKSKINNYNSNRLSVYLRNLNTIIEESDMPVLKIVNYLAAQNYFFSISETNLGLPVDESYELVDICRMCKQNNISFNFASNMSKEHLFLSSNLSILKNPRTDEFATAVAEYSSLKFESGDYIIRIPQNEKELFNEGFVLHHCVASYRDLIIDDKAIVVFLRKKTEPNIPYVTVQIDKDFSILQTKTDYDQSIFDPDIEAFIKEWKKAKSYLLADGKMLR